MATLDSSCDNWQSREEECNSLRQEKSWFIASVAVSLIVAALVVAPGAWAASTFKILHVFRRFSGGHNAMGTLVSDAAGNLYGTTFNGGFVSNTAFCGTTSEGCGVVFKLAPNPDGTWTEHVLHSFTGGDGANPGAGVIFDAAGNLYGTTTYGGLSNVGVVFKLTHKSDGTWTEHVLYSFTGGGDGAYPWAGVILDATGNLYGTTYYGGVGNFGQGNGVVFELTRSASGGWSERVLHAFLGYGANPYAGLLRGASGNLYGTASGGTSGGLVFEIKP
jgi:uncharacterized repeat protein (TIGR03803 family)